MKCPYCGESHRLDDDNLAAQCYQWALDGIAPLTFAEIITLADNHGSVAYRGKRTAAAFIIGWPLRTIDQEIKARRLTR